MISPALAARRPAASRRSMTLVELLVTVAIIVVVAGMILFGMSTAQAAARAAKTRTLIGTIDRVVTSKWEQLYTRRVPVDTMWNSVQSRVNTPREAARVRLDAIRKLAETELPDRWGDINWNDVPLDYRSGAFLAYYSAYATAAASSNAAAISTYQGAECLYLIVTFGDSDSAIRTKFSESDVGDVDGDGLNEFLDGWGKPIAFVRWPAGFFDNNAQPPGLVSTRQTGKALEDHDPFDLMNLEQGAYRLVPLIYSAGPDGQYDVFVGSENAYSVSSPNPYSGSPLIGTPRDTNGNGLNEWRDNITNHLNQ